MKHGETRWYKFLAPDKNGQSLSRCITATSLKKAKNNSDSGFLEMLAAAYLRRSVSNGATMSPEAQKAFAECGAFHTAYSLLIVPACGCSLASR